MQIQPTQFSTPSFGNNTIKFQYASTCLHELVSGRGSELTVQAADIVSKEPLYMNAQTFMQQLRLSRNPQLLKNLTEQLANVWKIVLGDETTYLVKMPVATAEETCLPS